MSDTVSCLMPLLLPTFNAPQTTSVLLHQATHNILCCDIFALQILNVPYAPPNQSRDDKMIPTSQTIPWKHACGLRKKYTEWITPNQPEPTNSLGTFYLVFKNNLPGWHPSRPHPCAKFSTNLTKIRNTMSPHLSPPSLDPSSWAIDLPLTTCVKKLLCNE